jgi:hypothetical protein
MTPMPRNPQSPALAPAAILRDCITGCCAAKDGRGRRWVVHRANAALALASAGPLSPIDTMCVDAAVRLGQWLQTQ